MIINGELQNGLGGGVCQVSTTVFNAAYEAGLPIDARTNHALYICHYPLGRDATVNYPDLDLKFDNDTGHWLLLRTFVGAGSLTVDLYGTPQHRRVETTTGAARRHGRGAGEGVDDPTLFKGETVGRRRGVPPRSTSVHRARLRAERQAAATIDTWSSRYVGEPTRDPRRHEAEAEADEAERSRRRPRHDPTGTTTTPARPRRRRRRRRRRLAALSPRR